MPVQIAINDSRPRHHNIWVVDLASGATKAVVTSRVDDTTPSWSR
jgi:hypothetical protein